MDAQAAVHAGIAGLGLTGIDLALLAVLLVSALVGLWRGLVFELVSLLTWVAAWLVAVRWGSDLGEALQWGAPGSLWRPVAGHVLAFVGVLLLGALGARLLKMLIGATPLRWIDRLLGLLFGAARGLLLCLALAALVSWTPFSKSPVWTGARLTPWLDQAVLSARAWWPARAP